MGIFKHFLLKNAHFWCEGWDLLLSSLPQNSPLDYFFAFWRTRKQVCWLLIQVPPMSLYNKKSVLTKLNGSARTDLVRRMGLSPVRPSPINSGCPLFSPSDKLQAIFSPFKSHQFLNIKKVRIKPYGLIRTSLVRRMGLEPTRITIRPSNVRVCQFRHPRISAYIYYSNF